MSLNAQFKTYVIILLIINGTAISYNQPKLCSNATWNVNAVTFIDNSTIGGTPHGIFINIHDTIFVAAYAKNQILIWSNSSINPPRYLTVNLSVYTNLFSIIDEDIYFENGNEVGRIDIWKTNANSSEFVTKFSDSCYGLFVDINNTLYCSMKFQNQVVSISLDNNTNTLATVAGNGSSGLASNELNAPWGIFVNTNFDLYVADRLNQRIQLFRPGQLNGTTVAGRGIPNNLMFNRPIDVVLDADGYLFIADNNNHRIIRAGPVDYYCVAGCSGFGGPAPNQFQKVYSLRFDSHANIYVADEFNYRVQKFALATNCYEETSTAVASTIDFITSSLFTTPEQVDSSTSFVPLFCSDPSRIGITCNITNTPCDMIQPCQNNSTCTNVNTTLLGYICSCPSGFSGTQCQFDYRSCQPNTCWNNGACEESSNTTFICRCEEGWQGMHCEAMISYCENIKCQNKGVCRPLFRNYTCECLGESYSGRHCETTASKTIVFQIASKSFASVAIIIIISTALFVVMMDLLKYYFNIDPIRKDLKRIERKKQNKKRKPPVILRFVYVNPSISVVSDEPTSTSIIQETIV